MLVPHDVLLDIPTTPGKRINALYVWIATHRDGSEGIIASVMPMGGDGAAVQTMPLFSSNPRVAPTLRVMAERAMELSAGRGDAEVVSIRMATFHLEGSR